MNETKIKIQKMTLADLIPADYNPRKNLKPGDPEYDKLRRSIESFGYVTPIIWNKRTQNVVGGHQRLKILLDLGYIEADAAVVDLSGSEEKALNVALNKIEGEWDMPKLKDLLIDLNQYDLTLTGFDASEIDEIIAQYEMPEESADEGEPGEPNFTYKEQYGVIIMCENESEQQKIYETLIEEGYQCRVVAT